MARTDDAATVHTSYMTCFKEFRQMIEDYKFSWWKCPLHVFHNILDFVQKCEKIVEC